VNKDFTSYQELLNTIEWKATRTKIVERDTFICKKCNNKNYINNISLKFRRVVEIIRNEKGTFLKFHGYQTRRTYVRQVEESILPENSTTKELLMVLIDVDGDNNVIGILSYPPNESNIKFTAKLMYNDISKPNDKIHVYSGDVDPPFWR
jgi:hypothetical protein